MSEPPAAGGDAAAPAAIICPFCGSAETELFALFGQFLLASQYYCRGCHTVFDVVRWQDSGQGDQAGPDEAAPPADANR